MLCYKTLPLLAGLLLCDREQYLHNKSQVTQYFQQSQAYLRQHTCINGVSPIFHTVPIHGTYLEQKLILRGNSNKQLMPASIPEP